jgi:MerR family mercuric resistance operon transcriptional regulator
MTTIAGLAKAGGVGVETVRYYQRRGLLGVPAKGDGIRRYDAGDVRRLRFIRSAQAAGFTREQIREVLARGQIAVLDAKLAELNAARASLVKLAKECGASASGPCPIIAAFENA